MFNNFKNKIIPFLLALFISITSISSSFAADNNKNDYNNGITILNEFTGEEITLQDGDTAQVPLLMELHSDGKERTKFYGSAGYAELTVSGTYVKYSIVLNISSTSFIGALNITDLTSGQSAGNVLLSKFSGSVKYNSLSKHKYRATLTGKAYNGGTEVAHVSSNASIIWTVN